MRLVRVVCDWQRCGHEITDEFHHRVVVYSMRQPEQQKGSEVHMDACSQMCALDLVEHYFKNNLTATVHVHKPSTVKGGAT